MAIKSSLSSRSTLSPNPGEKVDVAMNIFAKPFQTSLSLLSLLRESGSHVGKIWLQFEPFGSKFDKLEPYCIYQYLKEELKRSCEVFQPEYWMDKEVINPARIQDSKYRLAIRFQHAFENSSSRLLFLMHNDVYIFKDILGALLENMGEAFAIGPLGQCWNCPASNAGIMREVMGREPCTPDAYQHTRPNQKQLLELYRMAREKNFPARPYESDGFEDEFLAQPWPLPECRVNEWICLLDLQKTRPFCIPFGSAWPPGAYRLCSNHNLDIAVPWFRDMHDRGMYAKNFDGRQYFKHWVGTGNKSAARYAYSEDRALNILRKNFPEYIIWLEKATGKKWFA